MRMFAATAMGACLALSGSVLADGEDELLFSNPVFEKGGETDGVFSDAMLSQGNYESNGFAFGQRFSLVNGDARLKSIRFWAVSEYVFPGESQDALSTNISAIEIAIFRITPGTTQYPPVTNWVLPIGAFAQKKTGLIVPGIESPVFELDAALTGSLTLAAGDYLMSIGGVLVDPDVGSRFAWVDGDADGSDPSAQSYGTRALSVGSWGSWVPFTEAFSPSGAFELSGQIVPAPSTLLALAALAPRRRRRPD